MLYACDLAWWEAYQPDFAGEMWTVDPEAAERYGISHIEGIDDPGLCHRRGRIHTGGNSGYQAVGLAFERGAREMILLGYDMQRTGGRAHWHRDHSSGMDNGGPYDEWVYRFEVLARDLVDAGVKVFNATRQSALKCFPMVDVGHAFRSAGTKAPLLIKGMQGLGDNIYQRAVIRELAADRDVYVETSWPELYSDLDVTPVKPVTRLRTQAKNIGHSEAKWGKPPKNSEARTVTYAGRDGTILEALCASLGVKQRRLKFDLPFRGKRKRHPYVVVRPATVRSEWMAESRNPKSEYIAKAAEMASKGYRVISVADLQDGQEWAVEPLPFAHERFHSGELNVAELMELVAGASGLIGGVGWMVPAAVALKVPMLLIYGGWLFHNGPQRIFDPRMDTSLITQVMPHRPCMCARRDHDCDKKISRIDERINEWLVGLDAKRVAPVAA